MTSTRRPLGTSPVGPVDPPLPPGPEGPSEQQLPRTNGAAQTAKSVKPWERALDMMRFFRRSRRWFSADDLERVEVGHALAGRERARRIGVVDLRFDEDDAVLLVAFLAWQRHA